MSEEPLKALSAAICDSSRWVRLGAARAAPTLAPKSASVLLAQCASRLSDPLAVDEAGTIALALAYAGGDPLPLVARLFHCDTESLRISLEGDYDRWANFANDKIKSGDLQGPFRILMPFYAAWGSRNRPIELPETPMTVHAPLSRVLNKNQDSPAMTRANRHLAFEARSKFRLWRNFATNGRRDAAMERRVQQRFARTIRDLGSGRAVHAAKHLVNVALTDPNAWMRAIAGHTLPALGVHASTQLLATLAGQTGPRPNHSVFASIRQETSSDRWQLPEETTPETLAACLAGEVLERFTDAETAFALIGAAIAWRNEAQAGAARVVARMSAEVALPPLAWSALNLPSASERSLARTLLNRIVAGDVAFGIRFHRVGSDELVPGKLDWLLEIVSDPSANRIWLADPSVAVPILAEAIAILPEIVGTVGHRYRTPPTGARASEFMQAVGALRNMFAGLSALPAAQQARHPQAIFPESCKLGTNETLIVRLLPNATEDTTPPFVLEFAKGEASVGLWVLVNAPGFAVSPEYQVIQVSRDGPSDDATFSLRAAVSGEQAVDIKFMRGTAIIGQCCIVTRVTSDETSTAKAVATILLDPIDTEATQLQSVAQAVLRVKTEPDGYLAWSLLRQNTAPLSLGRSAVHFEPRDAADWGAKQAPWIRQMLETDLTGPETESVLAQLSAVGYELYAQIAPPTLAAALDALQENALVVVDSDADWIPWELLANRPTEKLWGDRFVLLRAPVATKPPNAVTSPPGTLSSTLDRALLVIGDKIGRPRRLAKRTFGEMAARAEPLLIEANWRTLRASVAGKDIVHFACHGRSEPIYHLSYGRGVGGRLQPSQAHALGLKWGAVVFANACRSSATDLLLAEFQSFGREFYYAGARPFIGTLGPIPEQEAMDFASLFYRYFAFAGLPVGHAMRHAKQDAAEKFKKPIWLFYCIYGNPSTVRRWSPEYKRPVATT